MVDRKKLEEAILEKSKNVLLDQYFEYKLCTYEEGYISSWTKFERGS